MFMDWCLIGGSCVLRRQQLLPTKLSRLAPGVHPDATKHHSTNKYSIGIQYFVFPELDLLDYERVSLMIFPADVGCAKHKQKIHKKAAELHAIQGKWHGWHGMHFVQFYSSW
jgi:hypothetical protein